MCGILFHFHPDYAISESEAHLDESKIQNILRSAPNTTHFPSESQIYNSLIPKIASRGPDFCSNINIADNFSLFSSVLSLRTPFTKQPLVSSNFIVQFNGELYNDDITGNDTAYIMSKLNSTDDIVSTLHSLDGEFAIVVLDKEHGVVYFGRDPVGKRSLVYSLTNELVISSVNPDRDHDLIDCANGVIYRYSIDNRELEEIPSPITYLINKEIDEDYANLPKRLNELHATLTNSVKQRIQSIQPLHTTPDAPLFSILFSGGLDCTVLAGLSASLSSSRTVIDLLNVAFDNPRTDLLARDAPDRKLAIDSWCQLQSKYPLIQFNLVEIDVSYEEYLEIRPKVIELMYPKNTEMDLSIAIAFYFASRGLGAKLSFNHGTAEFAYENATRSHDYHSNAKVLLSGLGADELYGGYHKLVNKSYAELAEELTRQISNIHERNLQRDDKVISDNGVEVRYPFLSNKVIEYSTGIEINYKVSKFILRQYATTIGLGFIAEEPKRAIQFGAKSAKMTKKGNKKGTDELS